MSEITAAIQAVLQADATLTALLTGGIYTKRQIGDMGIDPKNPETEDAYILDDEMNILQPCMVIKLRTRVPTRALSDVRLQIVGTSQFVQLDFYDDAGYEDIDAARARVYQLLHARTYANIGAIMLENQREYFAPELDNAPALRDDYKVKARLGA